MRNTRPLRTTKLPSGKAAAAACALPTLRSPARRWACAGSARLAWCRAAAADPVTAARVASGAGPGVSAAAVTVRLSTLSSVVVVTASDRRPVRPAWDLVKVGIADSPCGRCVRTSGRGPGWSRRAQPASAVSRWANRTTSGTRDHAHLWP